MLCCNVEPPQDQTKTSYYLWQIYHIEQDIAKAQKEIRKHKAELAEAEREHQVRGQGGAEGRAGFAACRPGVLAQLFRSCWRCYLVWADRCFLSGQSYLHVYLQMGKNSPPSQCKLQFGTRCLLALRPCR
jgi:hypothetical protein